MKKYVFTVVAIILLLLTTPAHICDAAPASEDSGQSSTAPSEQWLVDKGISSSNLNSITFFKNKLYITAGSRGTVRTSYDGISWETNTGLLSECSSQLVDVACSEDIIVIVGDEGTILSSSDGFKWTVVKPVTNNSIKKIIYGKKLFIAFTEKPGEILSSRDGLNWKVSSTGAKTTVNDAVFNGKVFVTTGNAGEICTSLNGLLWQVKTDKNHPSFSKIAWNGQMFITIGINTVSTDDSVYTSGVYSATSNNGYSWTTKKLSEKSMKKAKNFIDFTSCENITWTGSDFLISLLEYKGMLGFPDCNLSVYKTSDGKKIIKTGSLPMDSYTQSCLMVHTGSSYILVSNSFYRPGYFYGPFIYSSADGASWKEIPAESSMNNCVRDIICNKQSIISIGDGGIISSSYDGGANWVKTGGAVHMPQFWDGKNFISIDADNCVHTSKDGLSWVKQNKLPDEIWSSNLRWTGEVYTTYSYSSFSVSKDLVDWETTKIDPASRLYMDIGNINAFTIDKDRYIVSGQLGTAVSSDKKNWVTKKAPNAYGRIVVGQNSYIACNAYGDIDLSNDGLNWKRIHINDYKGKAAYVLYDKEHYIFIGSDGTAFQSPDGKTWTEFSKGALENIRSIIWTGNSFLADTAYNLYSSGDGASWHKESLPIDIYYPVFFAGGGRAFVYCNGVFLYKDIN